MATTIYDGTVKVQGFEQFSRHLNYTEIDPDSDLMRPVSEAIIRIQSRQGSEEDLQLLKNHSIIFPPWEEDKGPCQSKPIISYIIDPEGFVVMGSNGTNNLRQFCIRHALLNDPNNLYSDCEVVCAQPAHAEIMSLVNYLLYKGLIAPKDILRLFSITTSENRIVFGKIRHDKFLKLLEDKEINLKGFIEVVFYGQEICCDKCAQLLLAVGIDSVSRSLATHDDVRERRTSIHADISLEDIKIMQSETSLPIEG